MGLLILATHPPALLLWLAIHPLAAFWRRFGPFWTYSILGVPVAAYIVAVWLLRDTLLWIDLGTEAITIVLAGISVGVGLFLNRERRKSLGYGVISGMPELSKRRYPGKLMTDGIYGRVRHPRYIEIFFLVSGYALFSNYAGPYLMVLLSLPVIYLVVVLEERELRERFGPSYQEYCRRVRRFVPRLRFRKGGGEPRAG